MVSSGFRSVGMDERRGRAVFYLVGTVAVSVGVACGLAWEWGIVAFGVLCVVGSVIGRAKE